MTYFDNLLADVKHSYTKSNVNRKLNILRKHGMAHLVDVEVVLNKKHTVLYKRYNIKCIGYDNAVMLYCYFSNKTNIEKVKSDFMKSYSYEVCHILSITK